MDVSCMADGELAAAASGVFSLGGSVAVTRLGYGAMRITGPGIWGEPADPAEAIRVLRRAGELGVDFIETADCCAPAGRARRRLQRHGRLLRAVRERGSGPRGAASL